MNLLRAASTVSLLTLASRITGLGRELIIAAVFGAGAWTDAFQAAFRIPNMLRRLFAEGAFSQAFVPLLGNTRARDGDDATRLLISAVATVLFWALLLTCIVGVLVSPVVVWLMASGLREFDAAVLMTRWMFPYIGFVSLVALSAGVLNTWKHFAVPAASPVLLNLSMIGAGWWLAPWFKRWGIEPIYALAAGVMLGGVLQLAVQIPALRRIGVVPRIGLSRAAIKAAWHHPGVHQVLRKMAPALLGVSVAQVSLMINTHIASNVGVGAVSWLTYADRLMEFPTALLGVALGVVLIPQLSAAQGRGDTADYSAMLDWGLRLSLLLALPCAVALMVFAEPLVALLYQRGAFTAADVMQTQRALMAYGVGLLGLIGVKVLAPGFYARQELRTPVKIAVIVLVITQLLNLALVPWLGHAGLALSISVGAMLNSALLFIGLRRTGAYRPAPGWWAFIARVVVASTVLGAFLWWAAGAAPWADMRGQELLRVGLMAAALCSAVLVYFGILLVSGLKFRQFLRRG
ncbi:MAG: murein biosynthesis integral membrane protein MurJ [Rhizobacter sp.]|nr:murein biosynthesis integral membrane protein MurJ [Rhizobacter sp.]